MNTEEIKSATATGRCVFGTMVASMSPQWPVYIARAGVDLVFLDTEHRALDRESLSWMCRAFAGLGVTPIVRIPSPDPIAATVALDGGACGVVAPYVETVAQVKALVGAVKLRPLKGQKLQAILDGREELTGELKQYIANRCRDNLLIVNIESVPAMENLDAILAVPGLDGTLIGPHDLSCSLGIPERYADKRFADAIRAIITRTRKAGLIAGMHFMGCGPIELAKEWMAMGINLQIQQGDIHYASAALADELAILRQTARPADGAQAYT